jgi:hypothetical protein
MLLGLLPWPLSCSSCCHGPADMPISMPIAFVHYIGCSPRRTPRSRHALIGTRNTPCIENLGPFTQFSSIGMVCGAPYVLSLPHLHDQLESLITRPVFLPCCLRSSMHLHCIASFCFLQFAFPMALPLNCYMDASNSSKQLTPLLCCLLNLREEGEQQGRRGRE